MDANLIALMSIGIPLITIAILAVAFRPLIMGAMANSKKKKHLQQVGQRGEAKVLSVRDTGITVNNSPYIEMTVEIKGRQATFQMMMSRISYVRPGDMIQVIYDPSDPSVAMPG